MYTSGYCHTRHIRFPVVWLIELRCPPTALAMVEDKIEEDSRYPLFPSLRICSHSKATGLVPIKAH